MDGLRQHHEKSKAASSQAGDTDGCFKIEDRTCHSARDFNLLQFIHQHSGNTQEDDVPSALPALPPLCTHSSQAPKQPLEGTCAPGSTSWKLAELGWSRKTVPCILGHRHGESQNHHGGERPPRSPTYGHHGNVPQFTSPVPVTPPPPGQPGCQWPTTLSEKKLFHPT